MSRYGRFACMDCHIYVFIGKAVFREGEHINYFHIGEAEQPLHWQQPELNQVIWKMFADYAHHDLRVVVEYSDEYEETFDFVMIGGPGREDISEEDYLKNWDGLHGLQKDEETMSRSANFACMDCKVSFSLGKAIFREDGRVNYFHLGSREEPPNWQRSELNQVIWKMFADHARHDLRVAVQGSDEYKQSAEFIMIGGTARGDISEEDYLKIWDGLRD